MKRRLTTTPARRSLWDWLPPDIQRHIQNLAWWAEPGNELRRAAQELARKLALDYDPDDWSADFITTRRKIGDLVCTQMRLLADRRMRTVARSAFLLVRACVLACVRRRSGRPVNRGGLYVAGVDSLDGWVGVRRCFHMLREYRDQKAVFALCHAVVSANPGTDLRFVDNATIRLVGQQLGFKAKLTQQAGRVIRGGVADGTASFMAACERYVKQPCRRWPTVYTDHATVPTRAFCRWYWKRARPLGALAPQAAPL